MKTMPESYRHNNGTGLSGFTRTATSRSLPEAQGPGRAEKRTPDTNGRGGFKGAPDKGSPSMTFGPPTKSDLPKAGSR